MSRCAYLVTALLALLASVYYWGVTVEQSGGRYTVAGDGHYLYLTARSLAFDGDLDLTNQYRAEGDRFGLGRQPAHDGVRLPPREIGPALLMVPGLWLAHVLNLLPSSDPAGATAFAPWTLAGLFLLAVRMLQRIEPTLRVGPLMLAALTAALGFTLPYYGVGRAGYAHAGDALACACLLWTVVTKQKPAAVGFCLAGALLFRLQNALWLVWLIPHVWRLADAPRLRCRSVGIFVSVASLGLLPQAYLSLAHPGAPAIRWTLAFFDLDDFGFDLGRVLFGQHGLLRFTPLVGLALAGLALGTRKRAHRTLAWGIFAVVVAQCLLGVSVRDPDGGDAFGARRLSGLTAAWSLGYAWLWIALPHPWMRRALAVLLVAGITINLWRTHAAVTGALSLRSQAEREAAMNARLFDPPPSQP